MNIDQLRKIANAANGLDPMFYARQRRRHEKRERAIKDAVAAILAGDNVYIAAATEAAAQDIIEVAKKRIRAWKLEINPANPQR